MASKLNQTTANADARLVRAVGNRNVPGFVLVREWPFLAAAAAAGKAVEELFTDNVNNATGTVVNPKANGDEYAGTFVYSKIESRDENIDGNSDRATTIVETLTKVTSIASSSDLSDPFIRQNNLIIFPLRDETGETDQMVLSYQKVNPASRLVCTETITDGQLKAIADALVTGTPWVYVTRDFDEQDDKTATFTVTFKDYNSDATSDDDTDSILTEIQKASSSSRREVDIQTKEKVTASVADAIMVAGTGWDPPSGYDLLTLRRRNHADGTATVFQIFTKPVGTTFNPNADDQFEVVVWGTTWEVTKENEVIKSRLVIVHMEKLYTNTQAYAEAWANGADLSGQAWAADSYMRSQSEDTDARYIHGHFWQKIKGDYRWIATRRSEPDANGVFNQQVLQAERP